MLSVFKSGTNQPLMCRAVSNDGVKKDLVIKLRSGERMDEGAFQKEYIAAKLAIALLLKTPEPCLATITTEFIEAYQDNDQYIRLQQSMGLNFSTLYIPGLQLIGRYDLLNSRQYDEGLKIFVFDLIIQNPDRTILYGKPNLFTTGSDLWILDHEVAFSFLYPILGRPQTDPWILHANDMNMIENHVLFNKLRRKQLNFAILDNFLDPIDNDFWESVAQELPQEWHSSDFEVIRTHLQSIRDNWNVFVEQIKTLLS